MRLNGPDFPDSRIGASLKHLDDVDLLQFLNHFPDSRIGASLKLAQRLAPWSLSAELPRFANRGLIEAIAGAESPTDRSLLPRFANRGLIEAAGPPPPPPLGPSLPRFANRGLIEALGLADCVESELHTSPIRESGPH